MTKQKYIEERDNLANEYRNEVFKYNPSGFTCAPYVKKKCVQNTANCQQMRNKHE